jgi:outer membrane protein assembly factor BamA
VALNDFKDADDRFGFRRIDAELQQFLPLLKEHWVLAFRGVVRSTNVEDAQAVPYYLLPTLGGARMHRGYSDFRFQDRHVMLLSGEYRWLPSRVLDMALFVDAGKVARERRDLDFNGLKTAYGIGFRLHGPTFTPVRLDVARGDEGIRVHLTGGIAF